MRRSTLSIALMMATLAIAPAAAHGTLNLTPVQKQRHDVMGDLSKAMKQLAPVVRNGAPITEQVVNAAEALLEGSREMRDLFPVGSGGGDSRALPLIWEKSADYERAMQAAVERAETLAEAARVGSAAAMGDAFGRVAQSCKTCHDSYRGPEKH